MRLSELSPLIAVFSFARLKQGGYHRERVVQYELQDGRLAWRPAYSRKPHQGFASEDLIPGRGQAGTLFTFNTPC